MYFCWRENFPQISLLALHCSVYCLVWLRLSVNTQQRIRWYLDFLLVKIRPCHSHRSKFFKFSTHSTFFLALKDYITARVSVLTLRDRWRWWSRWRRNIEIQQRCRISGLLHQIVVVRLVTRLFRRGKFWYKCICKKIE